MSKTKICLVYNYAQHYRKGIFKSLDENLNIDFYFGDKMGDVQKIDYNTIKGFKKELRNIKVLSSIYFQKGILGIMLSKKYQNYIFLGEYYCISTWVALIISFLFKKKIFLWTHGWYGDETFLKRKVKKVFFNLSDGLLLYGNYAKELMIEEGFNANKLHVVFNSLDYEKQILVRKKLSLNNIYKDFFLNENNTIIFIGRLTKVKRLDLLIQAVTDLINIKVDLNLVLIGEGEELDFLKKQVIKNKIDKKVWFYGACYDEFEIGNLIFNADLCVSPGNVGLTAMHSMVYGTPVITHNEFESQMPEFEVVEEGVTGSFFKKNDLIDLEDKIAKWFKTSDNNRTEVRERCYEKIDTYYTPLYQTEIIKKVLYGK